MDAAARSAALEAEVKRADEFFRVLGWNDEAGASKELLDKLLK